MSELDITENADVLDLSHSDAQDISGDDNVMTLSKSPEILDIGDPKP